MTKVIFRKFNDGEVIAMFPYEKITDNTCQSYMHFGQHGEANLDLISCTKPVREYEYKELLEELIQIGYNDLKIIKRARKYV